MKHTENKKPFKPIVPAPHSRGPVHTLSPLTPDPSPTMSPEDPKHPSRRSSGSLHDSTVTVPSPSGRLYSKSSGYNQHQLPTFSDLNIITPTTGPSQGSSSSSSRPSPHHHAIYAGATPPMSPGHALLSPVSRPHCGITDPSQYSSSSSSSGFYQLPPPLQPFGRQSPHHSPAIMPQSGSHIHSHQSLPPLPPLPSAAHSSSTAVSSGFASPRTTTPQMSPMPNHYLISPGLGPMISPYPTPQHQPRHFPSPHHDPLLAGKQSSIPTMVLPASALSSSSSSSSEIAPSSGEITATLRSYSTILPQGDHPNPTSVFADRSPSASSSAPGSPRRHSMLPPQSTTKVASMTTSHRSSRSQTRKASSSSGSNNDISRRASTSNPTTTSSSSSSSTKRRGSSHNKVVDQETRDLMRKVSHSAIERRRRERINDKILQLKHLVPACVDEDHLHKLSILQSTIEYIHHLKAILPASVANAKVGKATNNNPNNKTTDMLEALGGSITQKFPLTPLMTTGLNHIYAKQIKLEKQQEVESSLEQGKHHEPPFHPSQSQSRSHHHSRENQDSVNMDGPPSAASSSSSSSSFVCPSSSSSSSDDDAKDGLLLLASQSSVVETENSSNKRGLRKKGYGFGSGKPY